MVFAFREPVHTAARAVALALVHRLKSGVGRMFEARKNPIIEGIVNLIPHYTASFDCDMHRPDAANISAAPREIYRAESKSGEFLFHGLDHAPMPGAKRQKHLDFTRIVKGSI
jgi:hypothetical protein